MTNLREVVTHFSAYCKDSNEKLEVIHLLDLKRTFCNVMSINQQVISFIMALKEDRVKLSAGSLFNVGIDLVPSVI